MRGKAGSILRYVPLAAILCVVPLLVRISVTDCGLSEYGWFSKSGTEYDFFLTCKMYGIIIAAAVMLAALISMAYRNWRAKARGVKSFHAKAGSMGAAALICLSLYAVLAVLSAIIAHSPSDAFFGGYAQHEPATVLVSYIIIFIYACGVMDSEESIAAFVKIAVTGAFVMAFLGTLQFFGADFFASGAGKLLITAGSGIDPSRISLSFGKGVVYMTLYNPDYVGIYAALMLPICAAGVFIIKSVWFKAMSGAAAVMLVLCVIGSGSVMGICAPCAAFAVFAMALIYIRNKKAGRIVIVAVFTAAAGIAAYACSKTVTGGTIYPLEYMGVGGDSVKIRVRGESLDIKSEIKDDGTEITAYDGDMEQVRLSRTGDTYSAEDGDAALSGLYIKTGVSEEGLRGFSVICGDANLFFTNDNEEGRYYYRNVYGKYTDDIGNSENVSLWLREDAASHRGYIWMRTLPLLAGSIFTGCGPDNFIYEFPNNDYLSLINNGYVAQVVTRPHSIYLQTAAQTGAVSLAAVLALYAIYFISAARVIRRMKKPRGTEIACIAIFAACAGYLVSGITNDSSVCTAPVSWMILAAGFCCNKIIMKEKGGK